jgi:hypothetical protein
MTFIILALLALLSLRPLSFAKYNWNKKQYLQAVGMVLIVAAMIAFPVYVLVSR